MATDPRAVSTGLGQGEAQVFKPFETDYFKRKANLALEAKEKAEADVAAAISKTPWSRDMGQFKKMTQELKDYYTQNSRALLEGDFDAKVELMNKQQQLLDYYSQSKAAESAYLLNKKMFDNDPLKYTEKTGLGLSSFANTPGDFDYSKLTMTPRFNQEKFMDSVREKMSALPAQSKGFGIRNIDGRNVLVGSNQADANSAMNIATDLYEEAVRNYGDQVTDNFSLSDLISQVPGMLKSTQSAYLVPDYEAKQRPAEETLQLNVNGITEAINTPLATKEGTLSVNPSPINKQLHIPFSTTINYRSGISGNAIPLSGDFVYKAYNPETEQFESKTYKASPGKDLGDIETIRKSLQQKRDWTVADIALYPTFPSGTTGEKTQKDISGFPMDAESQKASGKEAEYRYYAVLEADGQRILVPVNEIEGAIRQTKLRDSWLKEKDQIAAILKERGYEKALSDLLGTEYTPSSSSTTKEKSVSSEEQKTPKGTESTFNMFKTGQ